MEGNFVVNGWSVLGIEPEAEARYLGICYLMGASQNQDIILKVVIKVSVKPNVQKVHWLLVDGKNLASYSSSM